jgi:hypothetical protein
VKKAWVHAERDSEVRQAARAWRKAGAIDDRALARAEELFPAPWPDPTLVWRVLAFFFVSFAVGAVFASIVSAWHEHSVAAAAFVLAVLLAAAAEGLRPSESGAASASGAAAAFWSVTCLLIGSWDAAGWHDRGLTILLAVGAVAWAAAAWRWGYPAFALFSSASFFLFLARFAGGRALWFVLGAALAAACVPLLDRPALAPSARRSAAGALAVCLTAVYVAVNPYSLEQDVVESIAHPGASAVGRSAAVYTLAALGVVILPLFLLAWGIRSRRALIVDLAAVFTALSLATLRYYMHIEPIWAVLAVAGAGSIALALLLHRWLDRAPGRERRGFTADALFESEDKQQALGTVGTALALAPDAGGPPKPEPGAFQGGGGVSGGGGSSESF